MSQDLTNNDPTPPETLLVPLSFWFQNQDIIETPSWYTPEEDKILLWDRQERNWVIVRLKSEKFFQLPEE
jgi:hypothetical protein